MVTDHAAVTKATTDYWAVRAYVYRMSARQNNKMTARITEVHHNLCHVKCKLESPYQNRNDVIYCTISQIDKLVLETA